ncbi:cytochrome P450 [Acanthopleuribacter pedis]|uniref:Cytochrome P450 n=1 Tax=Acanthopleuribacter pedis TaxID=442870 RepID=A0A8J7Q8I0_9BACT|nr:cytochrome P450 [Acanthopleuribacter pedis]MBO1318844.1 cytochrome P450 [Acanthopleuribacter pedis]
MTLPPGPKDNPVDLLSNYPSQKALDLLDAYHAEYGDIFSVKVGAWQSDDEPMTWVMLTRPDHVKAFFQGDLEVLSASRANVVLFGEHLPKEGTFAISGETFKKRKRLVAPPLNGKRIKPFVPYIYQFTLGLARSWEVGQKVNMLKQIHLITIETILKTVFGIKEGNKFSHLCSEISKLEDQQATEEEKLGAFKILDDVILEETKRRKESGDYKTGEDIFSILLRAKDVEGDGSGLTDQEVHDELWTLLHAGFGSTSTMIAWVFHSILSHPEVYARVLAELDEVLGDGPFEQEHLNQLPYLDAVIKETFRLRPLFLVAGARQLDAEWEIGGYRLPKDTMVASCSYILQRRPELYENPDQFDPMRYFGKKIDPYQWAPFGGGQRKCPGMAFALQETTVLVATALREVSLSLENKAFVPTRQGWFVAPDGGPLVTVGEKRR